MAEYDTLLDELALEEWRRGYEAVGDFCLKRYREDREIIINFIDTKVLTQIKGGYSCGDRCNFGDQEIAIAPSGRIYPCERLVGEDEDDAIAIGHVSTGFDEKKRQTILADRGNVNGECITCELRNRCMNWCCCINYAITGRIDATDGIVCFHERLAIEVADRVASTLYRESNPAFMAKYYKTPSPTNTD